MGKVKVFVDGKGVRIVDLDRPNALVVSDDGDLVAGMVSERDVVREERRMRVDNSPMGKLFMEQLQNLAFDANGYHHSTIGYMSDINNISRADCQKYYDENYVGSNFVVAIVGDVYVEDVKKYAEKYFKDVPGGTPVEMETFEPDQLGDRPGVHPLELLQTLAVPPEQDAIDDAAGLVGAERRGQHVAPGGQRRLDAEAEERQGALEHDHRAEQQGDLDRHDADHVRQHVPEDDARPSNPGCRRGLPVLRRDS